MSETEDEARDTLDRLLDARTIADTDDEIGTSELDGVMLETGMLLGTWTDDVIDDRLSTLEALDGPELLGNTLLTSTGAALLG